MALQVRRLAANHILVEGAGVVNHGDVAESGSIAWAENELVGAGVVELLPGTYDFDTSITTAATTELIIRRGVSIEDGASNPDFTVNGTLRTGPYTIFDWDGTGAVTIHGTAIYDPTNWVALDSSIALADLRRKNAIINGDFNIWQRGTSFAAITNATYNVDRFVYYKTGAMVHTVSRDNDVPTQAESGHKSNYSLKVDCTTIDAAIAAGDHCSIRQKIEGYNLAPFMGNTVTLSFWVKATKTGIYCIGFTNSGNDRSYVAEYTVNTTNTWEKKTITLTFSDSGGTWDYINGTGVQMMWSLAAGTNFHAVANAWVVGNKRATVNQVNACDNVANNFWLSQVQFELGNVTTPFEYRLIPDELALCQRYFCKSYDQGTVPGANVVNGRCQWSCSDLANADSTVQLNVVHPVVMRAVPTIVTWDLLEAIGKVQVCGLDGIVPALVAEGESRVSVSAVRGAGQTSKTLKFQYTADAEL